MIIDAKDLIAGRLATYVAKKALLGEGISILNSDKVVISGKKFNVLKQSKTDAHRGTHSTGPFIPKQPDRYLKRIIRGMLPYKQPKGRAAFKRIKCYNGIPENFKEQKIEEIKGIGSDKLPLGKCVTLKEICRVLGGKE